MANATYALGASTNSLIINNGGTLNVAAELFIGSISLGNGTVTGANYLVDPNTSITFTNTGNALFNTWLHSDGGTTAFYQNGTGTTTIAGYDYYGIGSYTVNAGTLVASNTYALGGGYYGLSTVNVAGGTLTNAGFNLVVSQITLGNGTITGGGNISETGLTATNTGTALISESLIGSGAFTQNGTGTTTLSGNNTYTGNNTINAGTVIVGSSNALGAISDNLSLTGTLNMGGYNLNVNTLSGGSTGLITNAGAGTITLSDSTLSGTFAGQIVGSLSLNQNGSQNEILSGSNSTPAVPPSIAVNSRPATPTRSDPPRGPSPFSEAPSTTTPTTSPLDNSTSATEPSLALAPSPKPTSSPVTQAPLPLPMPSQGVVNSPKTEPETPPSREVIPTRGELPSMPVKSPSAIPTLWVPQPTPSPSMGARFITTAIM